MKKAFTLVELIVVITILAILGAISFISFQSFSAKSRDTKRLSDIKSLEKKINIEISKGTPINSLFLSSQENNLKINGKEGIPGFQGIINFEVLKEAEMNFQDPSGHNYLAAYTQQEGNFFQIATVNEVDKKAKLTGNYFPFQEGDSPSLFIIEFENGDKEYIVNDGDLLPYDDGTQGITRCKSITTEDGFYLVGAKFGKTVTGTKNGNTLENGNIKISQIFTCKNDGTFIKTGSEIIEYNCNDGYSWNGEKCIELCAGGTWKNPNKQLKWGPNKITDPIWNGNTRTYSFANSTTIEDHPVFKECKSLGEGWRVPSIDELDRLYNSSCKSNFVLPPGYVWSSSEFGASYSWFKHMVNGSKYVSGGVNKDTLLHVLCIKNPEELYTCEELTEGQVRASTNTTGEKKIKVLSTNSLVKSYSKENIQDTCYYKCDNGYVWNGNICEPTISCDNKNWATFNNKTTAWGPNAIANPTWNGNTKSYTFNSGTLQNYPVFNDCVSLGEGWRVPIIEELDNLYSTTCKSKINFINGYVWSSSENSANSAWFKNMTNGIKYPSNGIYKNSFIYIVCVNNPSELYACEPLKEGEVRSNTNTGGIKSIKKISTNSLYKTYNISNEENECYYKCDNGYIWNEKSCTPIVKCNNLDWMGFETKQTIWGQANILANPTWDSSTKTYSFAYGTINNYPLFKLCTDLGDGWRVPTIDELTNLYNSNCKTGIGFYMGNWTWSSTESSANTARYINMSNGVKYSANGNVKSMQFYISCVKD